MAAQLWIVAPLKWAGRVVCESHLRKAATLNKKEIMGWPWSSLALSPQPSPSPRSPAGSSASVAELGWHPSCFSLFVPLVAFGLVSSAGGGVLCPLHRWASPTMLCSHAHGPQATLFSLGLSSPQGERRTQLDGPRDPGSPDTPGARWPSRHALNNWPLELFIGEEAIHACRAQRAEVSCAPTLAP